MQSYDRYAYVSNSPLNHTDPSGHIGCDEDTNGHCISFGYGKPDWIPKKNLTQSGQKGFWAYLKLFYDRTGWWWSHPGVGGDGNFTIEDFVTLSYNEELGNFNDPIVTPLWQEGLVRNYYTWRQSMSDQYTSGKAALLNFAYSQAGADHRTGPTNFDGPTAGISIARSVVDTMIDPVGAGHGDWAAGCIKDAPCHVGSHAPGSADLQYIKTFINSGCQPSFLVTPANSCSYDRSFLFILDAVDSNYWQDIVDKR